MTRFLSISDVQARWSCGRTFVYSAVAEMEAGGYLKRLQLGRVQRVSEESVERWESLHAGGIEAPCPLPLPRPSRRRRPSVVTPAPTSILTAWREVERKASAA